VSRRFIGGFHLARQILEVWGSRACLNTLGRTLRDLSVEPIGSGPDYPSPIAALNRISGAGVENQE